MAQVVVFTRHEKEVDDDLSDAEILRQLGNLTRDGLAKGHVVILDGREIQREGSI